MEGPTPVSALIHAATMVTAGVYLIARTHPLFELAPTAADISAAIGALTLVFAASVALVVTDLKRIIAYSTISQIGYMIMGVSIAAYSAGMFHLMTHAFFKALMFMAAGSVIAAMAGEQNIDRMSGLRRAMPFTFVAFVIGALALAAFPGLSGLLLEGRDPRLRGRARRRLLDPLRGRDARRRSMTAFYAFRMVFRVFWRRAQRGGAASSSRATSHHAEPVQPGDGRARGHRRRLPRARAPHRRARARDERADGDPCRARDLRRRAADPGRHARDRELPRPDLRRLALRRHRCRRAASRRWRWCVGARCSLGGHRARLLPLRAPPRHDARGSPSASAGCTASSCTSGTSTSSTTARSCGPMRRSGAASSNVFERIVIERHGIGTRARRAGGQLDRARRPVRAPAQLRAAADDRRDRARPLLPDR